MAARGAPALNDATVIDARESGLTDLPGLARFDAADMVIAKGQGNYESLSGAARPIFFLFKVKCAAVAVTSGLPVGTLALNSRPIGAP